MSSHTLKLPNVSARARVAVPALLAMLAAAVLAAPVFAQDATHRIEGTVVDAQGLAIVGAQITLTQPQANLARSATSSTERFRFENLSPGAYTLRVTATGFQQQQLQIDLTSEDSHTVEVRLEPARITEE